MKKPELSFIIPVRNEGKTIEPLYREIALTVEKIKKKFEIIFIDDGSNDGTLEAIEKITRKDKRVRGIKLRGGWGKATALELGFQNAKGEILFTMDGDLQDDPKEIPNFLKKISEGFDLVVGWKKKRHDPWHKVIPSRLLNNFLVPTLTGIKLHDTNCGYKAMKQEVLNNINIYGEQFRFLPILIAKQNYSITEIVINHRERKFGKSKFGFERNIKGFLDLITIVFLTGYQRRPGHFFGGIGLLSFFVGFIIGLYITYLRLATGTIQYRQPLLFLGILLMIIGIQLISTGLLAEMIIYSRTKVDYNSAIEKTYGFEKKT